MEFHNTQKNDLFKAKWTSKKAYLKLCALHFYGIQKKEYKKNYSKLFLYKLFKVLFISLLYTFLEYICESGDKITLAYQYSKYHMRTLVEKKKNETYFKEIQQNENFNKIWENCIENWRIQVFFMNSEFLVEWILFCSMNNVKEECKNEWWGKWIEEITDKVKSKYDRDNCDYEKNKGGRCSLERFNNFLEMKKRSFREFKIIHSNLWKKFLGDCEENLRKTKELENASEEVK
ncbi:Plasmodium exported protein, unknown function [Plasmodium gallinaceum]|uniref:Plasmodium RESA N-terminal domain-containing protein n=1 Tax=Plasmodium gallinaceum TaxID=5849 RepID=A0A1J1GS31_PLAGA|nr:Plasmodium exported protein, unknown function [Plasmodium gallinaceum]CRG95235.1 Plasmodium exported protein, unknown function [Plasmodium gallinaceum]